MRYAISTIFSSHDSSPWIKVANNTISIITLLKKREPCFDDISNEKAI